MRLATWNVNSINARLETVLGWFEEAMPDVAVLQEIKCVDEKFPAEAFERLGYNVAVHGQKTYNGVAMLSKTPMEDIRRGLPGGDGDDHARYIEAVISGPTPVQMVGIYLPNGNPVGTEKFAYKLAWMDRLHRHAAELMNTGIDPCTLRAQAEKYGAALKVAAEAVFNAWIDGVEGRPS